MIFHIFFFLCKFNFLIGPWSSDKLNFPKDLKNESMVRRNSLGQAENVRDDQATRKPLFYVVAVIPLINAIFCGVTDITTAAIFAYLRSNLESYECSRADEEFTHVVQIPNLNEITITLFQYFFHF